MVYMGKGTERWFMREMVCGRWSYFERLVARGEAEWVESVGWERQQHPLLSRRHHRPLYRTCWVGNEGRNNREHGSGMQWLVFMCCGMV